jgi:hypothetical protein
MTMSILVLKRVLLADAATCAFVAVIGIADAAIVAPLLGLPENIVSIAGWICLPTAILLGLLALQAQPNRALLRLIVLGNLGWVAASLAVVAHLGSRMTGIGIAITIVQAIGVLGFAILEARGGKAIAAAA